MSEDVQIDVAVYQVLCAELGDEDAAEVLQTFLDDTSSKFAGLDAKLDDRAELTREAHSIKSSAATFGFVALSKLAREIEVGAPRLNDETIRLLLQKMQGSFDEAFRFAQTKLLRKAA